LSDLSIDAAVEHLEQLFGVLFVTEIDNKYNEIRGGRRVVRVLGGQSYLCLASFSSSDLFFFLQYLNSIQALLV
jgi:hypothetical protein